MRKDIPRKRICLSKRGSKAAGGDQKSPGGFYFGDYKPRYQEAFDIYEKAKEHAKEQKRKMK